MQKTITLFHISDLHFVDDSLCGKDLILNEGILSKRIAGWLNYHFNRKGKFTGEIRNRIIEYLQKTDWDYLVISGDITTLALEQEFNDARQQLEPLIQKGPVIMTPGNHDRYVKRSLNPDLMAKTFYDCFPFNQPANTVKHLELGESAIIFEIASSIPRGHLSSRGKIQTDLAACKMFINDNYPDRLKLAVGHYPAFIPENEADKYLHKLAQRNQLQRFLIDSHIDLYLHGHIHKTWQVKPLDPHAPLCLNAGGCCRYEQGPWSGFHKITITGNQFEVTRIHPDLLTLTG
jgi:3',5'-cyclic AMP phosphodiesterase CpdA